VALFFLRTHNKNTTRPYKALSNQSGPESQKQIAANVLNLLGDMINWIMFGLHKDAKRTFADLQKMISYPKKFQK